MSDPSAQPARVGLVMPYWDFWESSAEGAGLRHDREARGDAIAARLTSRELTVDRAPLLDSAATGRRTGERLREQGIDVVLVGFTMAAPPSHTLALLDELADVPLVLWTVNRGSMHDQFGMADIVLDGATVGTPMVTNVLTRSAIPFALVTGRAEDAETITRLRGELRAAVLARGLRGARIGRIGEVVPGYLCVDAGDDELEEALGIQVVRIGPDELRRRATAAPAIAEKAAIARETADAFVTAEELTDGKALDATFRLAAALRSLVEDHRLAAGTLNCHVPEIRYASDPGVTPCFALGRETSRGVPWTCTGDVLTAIAMLVAKRLSGAALYHEIESIDVATGECLLANSGEHDLAWCAPGSRPQLRANPWFRGDDQCGGCAWFPLRPGPATLLAFTPHPEEPSGFRFVVAEGAITERALTASPTVGGAFRFGGPADVAASWRRWVLAGANHHDALAAGHIGRPVTSLARLLGVGVVSIS